MAGALPVPFALGSFVTMPRYQGEENHVKRIVAISMLAALCLACGPKNAAPALAAEKKVAPPAVPNLPPDHPAIAAQREAASAMPAAQQPAANLVGEVLETMNGGGYTYVRLRTSSGEVWAATPKTTAKVGSTIALNAQMEMQNFESKTLKRTFPKIVFATPAGAAAPAAGEKSGDPATTMAQHAMFSQGPATETNVKVARAEGADAKTVAEVWAGKGSLKDKNVTIRGKVVKFTPQTLGVNWIHLRDGSGSADKHDNDITVTTKEFAKVGDVVVASGTLRLDKDFGAGYTYPVIVEGAKLKK